MHNRKGFSLLQISKEIGKSYTKIWGLCRALEIPTRNVAEADTHSAFKRSKHKRTPCNGTEEDKAYLIGFANGDLTARQVSGTAIMVTTTTTHPAFAELFHQLFDRFGHVYQYPMYEEEKGHKWRLGVRLDNSFQFLLTTADEAIERFQSRSLFMSWLAGIFDSEGNINIVNSSSYARLMLTIYNTDLRLLRAIKRVLAGLNYHPAGPYLLSQKGKTVPGWNIKYSQDMWSLQFERTSEAQALLAELPLRHEERVQRRSVGLSISSGQKWEDIETRVLSLRQKIDQDVAEFVKQAEEQFLMRKAKPKQSNA